MSSPRTRIVTLNLGSQSIELAEFRAAPRGGLILCGYRSRELLFDPATDGMRRTQMVTALREMLGELDIKSGKVNYSVAEESVFSRFVRLPAIEEEKIERIISFEAQQNVPFPIDEVVWDYQLIGGGLGEQIQVVLAAVKADLLDEINGAVEETGLRTSIVDLATMALYNAFRFNYGDPPGCSLLVDIGARTSNLLFIEPGRIFTRSVPIGGISVTSAIAKEFNEPFAAAEFRKRRDGFACLPGVEEALNGDVARVSKIVRNAMMRLHAEVMRSISHYCAQHTGNAPERVFLSGGGASTPSVREFFHEKMRVPIEFFNPLRNVTVADSARGEEIERSLHFLGEPVGLALRAATNCPMRLNLRPASVVRRQEFQKRLPLLIAAAACFIFGLLAWGAFYWRAAQMQERATARLEEKVNAMRRIETQLNQVRREIASLDNLSTPLAGAINDRAFWPLILEDLNARLPKQDIWITELVPISGGKPLGPPDARTVVAAPTSVPSASPPRPGATPVPPAIDGLLLRGLYLFNPKQQEVVVDYFKNLVESPWFAIDPKDQAKVIKPTTPNNTEWAFPYELRLDLKKPVSLP
ncbi:MAG TPA: type IV pilus assembly protein PilM [Chthoniobacterales bacterium]|nr:type IV pilus assembly protein PilM [Chthoniobacterales bacterium]